MVTTRKGNTACGLSKKLTNRRFLFWWSPCIFVKHSSVAKIYRTTSCPVYGFSHNDFFLLDTFVYNNHTTYVVLPNEEEGESPISGP